MTNGNPVVSIIVRSCNRVHLLEEAIESLRQQTYSPMEIVLVNDSPIPITADLLRSGDRFQITPVHLKCSRGRSVAANAGLQVAAGKYIGFLDDDDVLYPDHVQKTVEALESDARLGGVYTDLYAVAQEPDPATESGFKTVSRTVKYCRSFCREYLFLDNYIPINAMLFRRHCVDRIGYLDEGIEVLEDWDYWIRMALEYDLRHLCAVTGEFRIRNDGTNSTYRLKELFPIVRNYIFRKHAGRTLPLLRKGFLARHSEVIVPPVIDSSVQSRISHLEQLLQEKTRELENANVRLRRYVKCWPLRFARLVRRTLLGLPAAPPDP